MKLHLKKRAHRKTFGLFLFLTFGAIAGLVYLGFTQTTSRDVGSLEDYSSLDKTFIQGGIDAFTKQKTKLRARVEAEIKAKGPEEAKEATNIALYLFPDVLPGDNFEKAAGLELWAPMQKAIEEKPKSAESRAQFEELRANVWNYESPDRVAPNLSPSARTMIRIYDAISAP